MDDIAVREKALPALKKYRYAAMVLVLGLILMLLPGAKEEPDPTVVAVPEEPTLQEQLEDILGQLQGAGKVSVLLTRASGEETVYQTDREENRQDTVTITGSDRSEAGLVRQINPPEYLGAVILAQGADTPSVKLAIVEAVSKATGLSTDRISVLKMK